MLVSHALGAVRKLTDRMYVMYAGNIVEYAETKSLFNNPKHPYSIGLFAATPKLTGEGISDGIAGDIPSYINPPQGCRFAMRCKRCTDACLEKSPQLMPIAGNETWQVACHYVNKEAE